MYFHDVGTGTRYVFTYEKSLVVLKIGIIGTGKLAHKLAFTIERDEDYTLSFVSGRSKNKAKSILSLSSCEFIKGVKNLPEVDIVLISVKDDAIEEVSNQLECSGDPIVAHTSGIKGIEVLQSHKKRGIMYPLYSFFDKEEQDMNDIPFLIEAEGAHSLIKLENLAKNISGKVYKISAEEKKQLHLAAVFANNFSNFMMTTAHEILAKKNIELEILLPIIRQSCSNWMEGEAKNNQSGPALRGDLETQTTHLRKLTDQDQKEIYKIVSQAIHNFYK